MTSAHDPRTPLRPDIRLACMYRTIFALFLFSVFFPPLFPVTSVFWNSHSSSARPPKGIERFFLHETHSSRAQVGLYIVRTHTHTHRPSRNVFTTWRIDPNIFSSFFFYCPSTITLSVRPRPTRRILIIIPIAGLRVRYYCHEIATLFSFLF